MLSDKIVMAIIFFICTIPFFVYIYISEQREKKGKEPCGMMFIKKLKEQSKYRLLLYVYAVIGIFIVMFPPKLQYKSYESKFSFFLSIDKVDFYFFLYEVMSFILVGGIMYIVFYKNRKEE